jgi:hypothetical protein
MPAAEPDGNTFFHAEKHLEPVENHPAIVANHPVVAENHLVTAENNTVVAKTISKSPTTMPFTARSA